MEAICSSSSPHWTLQFTTNWECSNWTYKCGEHEFLSWQNAASAGSCDSCAAFALNHRSVAVLRVLLDWAARFDTINPLICRVSMRDSGTLRLLTSTPQIGCAVHTQLASQTLSIASLFVGQTALSLQIYFISNVINRRLTITEQ